VSSPQEFTISNAYPNPFNPTTSLDLIVNNEASVSVRVYDLNGNQVDVIHDGSLAPGSYTMTWSAAGTPSGVYLIKSSVGNSSDVQKVVLLK